MMRPQVLFLSLAAALTLWSFNAGAEMQRLRVCIGENASHCNGVYSDFYKISRATKGDIEHLAGNAICTLGKGHLLNINADDAKETHDGDCCGYTLITVECEIDLVTHEPTPSKRGNSSRAR